MHPLPVIRGGESGQERRDNALMQGRTEPALRHVECIVLEVQNEVGSDLVRTQVLECHFRIRSGLHLIAQSSWTATYVRTSVSLLIVRVSFGKLNNLQKQCSRE